MGPANHPVEIDPNKQMHICRQSYDQIRFVLLLRGMLWLVCMGSSGVMYGLPDTESPAKQKKDTLVYHHLFVGSKFQNQFAFVGRTFGYKIPFVSGDVTFSAHSRWWISTSAFHFFDPAIQFQTSLAAGYGNDLSKRIDYNFSYSQFLIPPGENVNRLQSLGFAQATVGLDWTYVYSTLQAQVMAYSSPDVFITSQHSRYFQFTEKLFGKFYVSFQPSVSVTFGTTRFYYSDDEALAGRGRGVINPRALQGGLGSCNSNAGGNSNGNGTGSSSGNGNPGGNGNGNAGGNGNGNAGGNGNGNAGGNGNGNAGGNGNPGGNGNGNQGGNGTGTGNGNATGGNGTGNGYGPGGNPTAGLPTIPEGAGNSLNLLSWEAALPVTIQWGSWSLEWTSRYTHPLHVIEGDPSQPALIQAFDLYYTIPVKKKKKIKS